MAGGLVERGILGGSAGGVLGWVAMGTFPEDFLRYLPVAPVSKAQSVGDYGLVSGRPV